MQKKLHFLILDADTHTITICQTALESQGHSVTSGNSSSLSLEKLKILKPDCILCDLSQSSNSLVLITTLRTQKTVAQPSLLIIAPEKPNVDYAQIFQLRVNGYLTKPLQPDALACTILAAHKGEITVQFWGARGTLPVPGKQTTRYGGNTNCISLNIAQNHFFIFDAGTGIKELSNYILRTIHHPITAKIFLSHPHYDHINGIPFFVPLYLKDNQFEFFGTQHANTGIEKLIADQMDGVYFPITISEFAAKLIFRDLKEETFYIDDVEVQTIFLTHPGKCLGYRIHYLDKLFCYVTDNEIYPKESPQYDETIVNRLVDFITDADVLIMDATYSDEEYFKKIGWGHSCVSSVVEIAHHAHVKQLCLYHHDPDQFDKDIDNKVKHAKAILKTLRSKTRCLAAKEGDVLHLT